jgi:short subunit dehydrogenase-like uncharacterized protein
MATEFDIIIYGATGYTGRLVAEHFLREYAGKDGAPTWAMAGRSQEKLVAVRDEIGAPADTPLVVADASNPADLEAMCERTRVVLTTVGPYMLYGEPLVAACAKTGTDYADLSGEPLWMHDMIGKYSDAAKASGARICFSSGFDSIPFDLGVLMLQKEAQARFGKPATRVKGRMRGMAGGPSGGTVASMGATMAAVGKNPSLAGVLKNPFCLAEGFEGPAQPDGDTPAFDEKLGSWAAPFVMAVINTKTIHRTNFLLGHPYGEDFQYDEMVLTGPGDKGEETAKFMAKNPGFGDPSAKLPEPGEGPTKDERENGFYDAMFVGETAAGETIQYGVKGKYDPGYGSTSRMIGETGMALLESDAAGGIGTPGALLGEALVARLQEHAEISFAAEN